MMLPDLQLNFRIFPSVFYFWGYVNMYIDRNNITKGPLGQL